MKSEVAHRIQWVFFVLVILLHKSDAEQGTNKCSNYSCGRPNADGSCQKKKKCMFHETWTIENVKLIPRSQNCNGEGVSYGREMDDYVWTKHCCTIIATVCYKVQSNVSMTGNTTTMEHIQSNMSVSGKNTTQDSVTMEGDFDNTEIQELQEDTGSLEIENVSSSGAVNAQTITAESQASNVVLKVALPVGAFVLLILLAVICFVFRRKVNGLLMKFRQTCDKGPDQSNPVYGVNGPAFENTNSDKFDNLTYAMQTGQEYLQPGSFPTVGHEYSKPVPREKTGGQTDENPSNTVGSSPWSNYRPEYKEVNVKEPYDTTYQTLSDESYNTSYDHIMGSNAPTLITPKAKLGGTAYDNAAI